ncbi:MAG: hypothetical protein H6643_10080 [Caldilineaceae bacterium]|nr:hypothetical protein [Caldilineaceae bacterium]
MLAATCFQWGNARLAFRNFRSTTAAAGDGSSLLVKRLPGTIFRAEE